MSRIALQRPALERPALQRPGLVRVGEVAGNGPALSIDYLTADNYITAAEMSAVTISGTSKQIADSETVSITATDGTNNYTGTATINADAWTASPIADFTGWDDGAITVTATLDSDNSIFKHRVGTLDAVNDAPIISGNLNPSAIPETAQIGSLVVALSATDPNLGDAITWSIQNGNTGNAFAIDQGGNITVADALDYETLSSYALVIRASDGALWDEETVNITISDVAVFVSGNASPSIPESTGTSVTIAAYTADAPNAVTWSIESGNAGGEFDIDSNGNLLTTAVELDYETASNYPLAIRATDAAFGEYGELNITVSITDVNETPVVDAGQTAFDLNESESIGFVVHTFTATDPDAGDTGTLSIVSGNTNNDFEIEPTTGELSIANALDYATTPSYSLGIRYTDAGGLYHDIVCVLTVTQSAITRQLLTLDGVSSYMKTATISVSAGDVLELDVVLTTTGSTQYLSDTNDGDANRFYLLINGSNQLNYYPAQTVLTIDDIPISSGVDISSYMDGAKHRVQAVFERSLNLGTFGVNGLISNGYFAGVFARIRTEVNGVETIWGMDSGSLSSEEAQSGVGTMYFYNVDSSDWDTFTLNVSTTPDQWENGDKTRIIPITGVG